MPGEIDITDGDLENSMNAEPEQSFDENIYPVESQIIIPKQEPVDMEVHHHPDLHHRPKPWKEYLLEGLMIFIAVTLGFFAESYREYLSDRSKEKEYIFNIKKDLTADTIKLNIWIPALRRRVDDFDSLIAILEKPQNTNKGSDMYFFARLASRARTFEASNNTILELKSSGTFRIITKEKVRHGLMDFETLINNYLNVNSIETNESSLTYPLIGKLFDASVFDNMLITKTSVEPDQFDFASGSRHNIQKPQGNPQLRHPDEDTINMLIYYLHQRKSSFFSEMRLLEEQKKVGISLIQLLNEEYHLNQTAR
jgi:hypothetical protein